MDIVGSHHEKYDGSGYPAGLSHDKIPLEARIFAIVDAFDAITSQRPYRQPQELERALALLEQDSGSHFDPVLLAPFIEMAPQLHGIVSKLAGKALEKEAFSLFLLLMQLNQGANPNQATCPPARGGQQRGCFYL